MALQWLDFSVLTSVPSPYRPWSWSCTLLGYLSKIMRAPTPLLKQESTWLPFHAADHGRVAASHDTLNLH